MGAEPPDLSPVRSLHGQGRALSAGLRRPAHDRRAADPSGQQLPGPSGRQRARTARLSRAGDELAVRQQRGIGTLGAHRPRREDRRRVPEASGWRAHGRAVRTQRRRRHAEFLSGRRREGHRVLRRARQADRLRERAQQPSPRRRVDSGRRLARQSRRPASRPEPCGRNRRGSQGHQPGARSVQPGQRVQAGGLDVLRRVQAEVLRGAGRPHEPPHRRGQRAGQPARKRPWPIP